MVNSEAKKFPFSRLAQGYMRLTEWGFSTNQLVDFMQSHINLGVTTIDQADIYGGYTSEAILGKALQAQPELREQIQLVSKCVIAMVNQHYPENYIKHYNHSKAYIKSQVERSLQLLHTDYLDLLLIHRPSPLSHPEEVAAAFAELKAEGKVLHFGVSNYTNQELQTLQHFCDEALVTNQIEYSPLCLDPHNDGTIAYLQQQQVQPMAWSPFAGGRFFKPPETEQEKRMHQQLQQLSEKYACNTDQLILAWILHHPIGFVPIVGSGKIDRIKNYIKALELELELQDWFAIYVASTGKRVA